MTGGSVGFYPFPEDDGETLHGVLSKLLPEDRIAMTSRPTEDWLLEVPPPLSVAIAAVFARLGVRRVYTTMESGRVLVPALAVPAIQASLARRPNGHAMWSKIEGIEFSSARSRRAFETVI